MSGFFYWIVLIIYFTYYNKELSNIQQTSTKVINENIDALNNNAQLLDNAKTPDQQYIAEQYIQDNIIADNVWNYGGDGSVVIEYINNMVKDKKMSQETADEYIKAVEVAEKNYEKHSLNSILTEAGATQAFFRETRKTRKY